VARLQIEEAIFAFASPLSEMRSGVCGIEYVLRQKCGLRQDEWGFHALKLVKNNGWEIENKLNESLEAET
jgi:hypothetical protein